MKYEVQITNTYKITKREGNISASNFYQRLTFTKDKKTTFLHHKKIKKIRKKKTEK